MKNLLYISLLLCGLCLAFTGCGTDPLEEDNKEQTENVCTDCGKDPCECDEPEPEPEPEPDPEPEIELSGLKVPEYVAVGEVLEITGSGFNETSEIAAVKGEDSIDLEVTATETGLSVSIPSDMSRGHYSIVLFQDNQEKILSEDVWITIRKSLENVSMELTVDSDNVNTFGWYIDRNDDGEITSIDYRIRYKSSDGVSSFVDTYVVEGLTVTNTANGTEMANNKSATYTATDGIITSAAIDQDVAGKVVNYTWNYGEDGRLLNISEDGKTEGYEWEPVYDEDGNITALRLQGFDYASASYEGATKTNNPYAPNFNYAVYSVLQYIELAPLFPYFRDEIKAPNLLPSEIDVYGYGSMSTVKYEFDKDGYVEMISWKDSAYESSIIEFEYAE